MLDSLSLSFSLSLYLLFSPGGYNVDGTVYQRAGRCCP